MTRAPVIRSMQKAVHNTTFAIKKISNFVQKLRITSLEGLPERVGHQIGILDGAGRRRINKHRNVGEVGDGTPPASILAEIASERLYPCFPGGFVQNDQATLSVAFTILALQKSIKSCHNLLESIFDRVFTSDSRLFDYDAK